MVVERILPSPLAWGYNEAADSQLPDHPHPIHAFPGQLMRRGDSIKAMDTETTGTSFTGLRQRAHQQNENIIKGGTG